MDSVERGMNPVAITTFNLRKEYLPSRGSNQRPPVLKSCAQPTELWGGLAYTVENDKPIVSVFVSLPGLRRLISVNTFCRCIKPLF